MSEPNDWADVEAYEDSSQPFPVVSVSGDEPRQPCPRCKGNAGPNPVNGRQCEVCDGTGTQEMGVRPPIDQARAVAAEAELKHRRQESAHFQAEYEAVADCCEWHSRTCEPPYELCCTLCPERAHTVGTRHADGSICVLAVLG